MKKIFNWIFLLDKRETNEIYFNMRVSFYLILVTIFNLSASVHSQPAKITIKMNQVSLIDFFTEIQEKTNYDVFYVNEQIPSDIKVSIDFKRRSINYIFYEVLKNTDLDFKIIENNIVVSTILKDGHILKQQQIISGKVTDSYGEPLPGVNILKIGTSVGTLTDLDGNYSIEATQGDVLEFSYVGMKTKDITVGTQLIINVQMTETSSELEEIVVVGYGTKSKTSLTGAVSSIKSENLIKSPTSNTSELLTGQVSGLMTKQTSGVPGDDNTSVSIRGYGTPLVLVDGIQTSMDRLDPNDIESISVLKDASAAIYGARAGNGVILVTTKRGIEGKPKISYHGNISFQQPTVLPKKVDSWDYAALWREGRIVTGQDPDDRFTEEDVEKYRAGNDPDYINEDWYGQIFKDWTPMQQHNLSVRGGSERIKYYASTGFLNQESAYRSGDLNFKRYNIISNLDAEITDDLSVGFDLSYRREDRNSPGIDVSTMYNLLQTAQPIYPAVLPDPDRAAYSGFSQRSPYAATQKKFGGFNENDREYFTGNIELKYMFPFVEGLSVKAKINYLSYNTSTKSLKKPYDVWEYVNAADEYIWHGTQNSRSSISEYYRKMRQLYPSFSVDYKRVINDHKISGLFLVETIDISDEFFSAKRYDLISTDIPYLFAGGKDGITNDGGASESGRMSYVGRAEYSYKNKYFVEATLRADATGEKFAKDSRWGYFPSVSGAWIISKESFMSDASSVDRLKIRLSYSQSGVDNVGSFRFLSGYEILDATYLIDGNSGQAIRSTGLANPNVTWQDNTTYNFGVDGSFWDGKLGFEFNVFYRLTEGIFGTPKETVPSTFGAILPQLNINSQDDRGFDLLLTHRNRINEDFTYSISGNIGLARKKWVKISEDISDDPEIREIEQREGRYTNRVIGYVSDGLFMNQEQIDNHPVDQDQSGNSTLRPGDIIYKDLNGDGVIDSRDRDEIGFSGNPDLSYGINLNAAYKSFSLFVLFQGAAFSSMNITGAARSPFSNESIPFDYHKKYRWTPDPNDISVNTNSDVRLPAITGVGTSQNNNKTSDFWLQNNDYFRLKTINLSYAFPQTLIEKWGFDSIMIYMAGNNLITWSKLGIYKNSFDPEGPSNQNGRSYPIMKTMTFGLKVSL